MMQHQPYSKQNTMIQDHISNRYRCKMSPHTAALHFCLSIKAEFWPPASKDRHYLPQTSGKPAHHLSNRANQSSGAGADNNGKPSITDYRLHSAVNYAQPKTQALRTLSGSKSRQFILLGQHILTLVNNDDPSSILTSQLWSKSNEGVEVTTTTLHYP
jgi:hypothetical protein